jgi:amino-acid N-acetyltransferase
MRIVTAPPADIVKELLSASELPTSDMTPSMLETFFAYEDNGNTFGVVGLEMFETVALLRSLAVRENCRNKGIGSKLLKHAEGVAEDNGIIALYLLTVTAESFVSNAGYEKISRDLAPEEIKETSEFSGIFPVSSSFMMKKLIS